MGRRPWVFTVTMASEIAVLFSHAAHPVIVHWVSEAITTDVPGYAVGHLV